MHMGLDTIWGDRVSNVGITNTSNLKYKIISTPSKIDKKTWEAGQTSGHTLYATPELGGRHKRIRSPQMGT